MSGEKPISIPNKQDILIYVIPITIQNIPKGTELNNNNT